MQRPRIQIFKTRPKFTVLHSPSPVQSSFIMGNGAFSLVNPRNRLILIFTTFFALAFLILSPRTADRDGYTRSSRFTWTQSPVSSLFGWAVKPAVEEVLHPIPQLMHDAQVKFRAKIMRQSKTLPAAVKEYRARYKRDPPKGFDDWFQFAQDNKVKIIDEYDGLNNDLEPFWGMSGEELRRRALQVRFLFCALSGTTDWPSQHITNSS